MYITYIYIYLSIYIYICLYIYNIVQYLLYRKSRSPKPLEPRRTPKLFPQAKRSKQNTAALYTQSARYRRWT